MACQLRSRQKADLGLGKWLGSSEGHRQGFGYQGSHRERAKALKSLLGGGAYHHQNRLAPSPRYL
jgi:hypothetical protein